MASLMMRFIRSIAAKTDCSSETLRNWVRQAERDRGVQAGPTTDERERIKALERENRELRQANEIPKEGVGALCPGGAQPPVLFMIAFIDEQSCALWGRADLLDPADRPVDVSCTCCARAIRSGYRLGPSATRC